MRNWIRSATKACLLLLLFYSAYHFFLFPPGHADGVTNKDNVVSKWDGFWEWAGWTLSMLGTFMTLLIVYEELFNKYYWQHKLNIIQRNLFFWRWYKPRRYRGLTPTQLSKVIAAEIRTKYQ